MDCEKFESALMDELYGELDELTSAAAKRHVSGCARCAALLGGLRATRRVAALPRVEPPADLEQRILAAAAAATPKVVPLRGRLARAVSLAGSWAMRPQTAMAAVFLVMIGTSVLLLRGKSSRAPASAEMTVTEEGTPAPAAPPPSAAAAQAAASAALRSRTWPMRASGRLPAEPAPDGLFAAASPPPTASTTIACGAPRKAAKAEDALGRVAQGGSPRGAAGGGMARSPAAAAPSLPRPPVARCRRTAEAPSRPRRGGGDGAALRRPRLPLRLTRATSSGRPAPRGTPPRARGAPCPSGARFDDVASRAPGTQPGWDALFEGALCYESLRRIRQRADAPRHAC